MFLYNPYQLQFFEGSLQQVLFGPFLKGNLVFG